MRRWLLSALLTASLSCAAREAPSTKAPREIATRTLKLAFLADVAGMLEPCGCVTDSRGGIDRLATALAQDNPSLVVGVGSLFFPETLAQDGPSEEQRWRAETLATSLKALGLRAWSGTRHDDAAGPAVRAQLSSAAGVSWLGPSGSATSPTGGWCGVLSTVTNVAGQALALVGLTVESGASEAAAEQALSQELRVLHANPDTALIGLFSAPRGLALRLVERHPEFQVVALGTPGTSTGPDDDGSPPEQLGSTLVVEPANHLRGVVLVTLNRRGDWRPLADGSQLREQRQRAEWQMRARELSARLADWRRQGQPPELLARRQQELTDLEQKLAAKSPKAQLPSGSYFTVTTREITEQIPGHPEVRRALDSLGQRINRDNAVRFAERQAPTAAADQRSYVGVSTCANCHAPAVAFWKKTRHATAYATLVTRERQFHLDCVGCHVTGFQRPGGSEVVQLQSLENVQCETCHGPGSEHARTANKAAILGVPAVSSCVQGCHHSPHERRDWDPLAARQRILGAGHGRPAEE